MHDYVKKNPVKNVQQNKSSVQPEMTNGIPNSVLTAVMAGEKHADSSMMGHSQNLAPSIAAKMSRAFGMDLMGMQVYQSDAMKGTGMQGMAQGNKIVLSSDVNLNTTAGQAVLGHEISHIRAQSQGIGMGHSGLYENAALEHQADTEGLLAAQGRSIYSDGIDTGIGMQYGLGMQGVEGLTPLGGGMSAGAGAPMQAKKDEEEHVGILGPLKKPESAIGEAWKSTKKFAGDFMDMTADFAGNTLDKTKNAIKGAAGAVWGKTKGLAGEAWGSIQSSAKLRDSLKKQYAASAARRKENPPEIPQGNSKYKPKSLKLGEAGKLMDNERFAYIDWIEGMSLERKMKEAKKKLPKYMYERLIAQVDDPLFEDTVDTFLLQDARNYSYDDLLRSGVYKEGEGWY